MWVSQLSQSQRIERIPRASARASISASITIIGIVVAILLVAFVLVGECVSPARVGNQQLRPSWMPPSHRHSTVVRRKRAWGRRHTWDAHDDAQRAVEPTHHRSTARRWRGRRSKCIWHTVNAHDDAQRAVEGILERGGAGGAAGAAALTATVRCI